MSSWILSDHLTMDSLREFLNGRARAMENMECKKLHDSQQNPGRSSRITKVLASVKVSAKVNIGTWAGPQPETSSPAADTLTFTYSYCKGEHYITTFVKFRALTPVAWRQNIYATCLGRHSGRVWQTIKRCQTCNERPHTKIHVPDQRRKGSS